MMIGVVSDAWWSGACVAAGRNLLDLPRPRPAADHPCSADLSSRVEAGRKTRELLRDHPVEFMLDQGGAGLTFVQGPAGLTALKLTHELAGVPLLSRFVEPITTGLQGLPWSIVWPVLQSKMWIKAVADAEHAADLERFGIPSVVHLPPAAPEWPYKTGPLDDPDDDAPISYIGDAPLSIPVPAADRENVQSWIGTIGVAACGATGPSFDELYHKYYRCGAPPDNSDLPEQRADKCAAYLTAKSVYLAHLAMWRRDRFVIFLSRRFGGRFQLAGSGWREKYGLTPAASPASVDARVRMTRSAAINIVLGSGGSGVDPRCFEVTAAGGLLLCHDHPGLRECFEVGSECDTFSDERTLLDKIDHYHQHADRRREIALAGQRRTLDEHLARHRLDTAIALAQQCIATLTPTSHTRLTANAASDSVANATAHKPTSDQAPCMVAALVPHGDASTTPRGQSQHAENDTALAAAPPRVVDGPGKLLVLLNPGKVTRNCLIGMATAARRLGIDTLVTELYPVWEMHNAGQQPDGAAYIRLLKENHVKAVLSYTLQGAWEWGTTLSPEGRRIPLVEQLGIPHLMWWTDHPQWADEGDALDPDLQELLRSPMHHHFVKSDAAAHELREILGWSNCFGLPVAEDPEMLTPASGIEPEFDIVAITGAPPRLDPAIERFLDDNDPDVDAITAIVAEGVAQQMTSIWHQRAPSSLHDELDTFGRAWLDAKCRFPLTAAIHLFERLEGDHREATEWLRTDHMAYFHAVQAMWELRRWERTFVLCYLARHFRVGVLGHDWSSRGFERGEWIDYEDQPRAYARGRIALNVTQPNDEEGVAHKPFQIAASEVPMLHINRTGLADLFTPETEMATFDTPRQARDTAAELLADPLRRRRMAIAARERFCREHTWEHRLAVMFRAAGVTFPGVVLPDGPAVSAPAAPLVRSSGMGAPAPAHGSPAASPVDDASQTIRSPG